MPIRPDCARNAGVKEGFITRRRFSIRTIEHMTMPDPSLPPVLPDETSRLAALEALCVLDTAPAYGRAEAVVGELMTELKNRDKYFIATKVSLGGRGGGGGGVPARQRQRPRRPRRRCPRPRTRRSLPTCSARRSPKGLSPCVPSG